jgi:multidrug efflux pump
MAATVADAAGAHPRAHRRRHRDDVQQLARQHPRHPAVRPLDRDIDGAARDVQAAINAARGQLPSEPAQQPHLPQGQPGRRADHDPGAHLRHAEPSGPDVRRRVDRAGAAPGPGGRGRAGEHRRRRAAGGARRGAPADWPQPGIGLEDVRSRHRHANANRPKGVSRMARTPGRSWGTTRPARPPTTVPLIVSGRAARRCAWGTWPGARRGRGRRNYGYANGRPAVLLMVNRQPGANIIETVDRVRPCCPCCAPACRRPSISKW